MFIGVGVSYSVVSNLYVSFSGLITYTSVGEERAIFLLLFTCNYVVLRSFLFLLVLGCVILLWHSLGLPYNQFAFCNKVGPDVDFFSIFVYTIFIEEYTMQ